MAWWSCSSSARTLGRAGAAAPATAETRQREIRCALIPLVSPANRRKTNFWRCARRVTGLKRRCSRRVVTSMRASGRRGRIAPTATGLTRSARRDASSVFSTIALGATASSTCPNFLTCSRGSWRARMMLRMLFAHSSCPAVRSLQTLRPSEERYVARLAISSTALILLAPWKGPHRLSTA